MVRVGPLVLLLVGCAVDDAPARAPTDSAGAEEEEPLAPGCEEGETPEFARYVDEDEDGWGVAGTGFYTCDARLGATLAGDCDDHDDDVHPGAPEICAGPDRDCDGLVGESTATDAQPWYSDEDGDGFGAHELGRACEPPEGVLLQGDDCDDSDAGVFPGATEVCDGVDQDCDLVPDDGADGDNLFCFDGDLDGYGDPTQPATACQAPTRHVVDCTDCDDQDTTIHPGATELACDPPGDGNCDGVVDDVDGDGDGFSACDDCDDGDPGVRPGAGDPCGDGVDGDCDGADALCLPEGPALFGEADGADSVYITDTLVVADVDGDGQDDLVVGAERALVGGVGGGGVFAYLGPLTGDRGTLSADLAWMSATRCFACGSRVLVADFDGDGTASLVVSDDSASTSAGVVYLLADAGSGTLDTPTLAVTGDGSMEHLGEDVLALGPDLDGDGAADLVIGSTQAGLGGTVIGVSSGASGELVAADATIHVTAEASGDELGSSVVRFDSDGDGLDDLVAGAPGASPSRIYQLLAPLPASVNAADADGVLALGSHLGTTGIAAGDLDEDGYADVLTGGYSNATQGTVWLVPGGEWPSTWADIRWYVSGDRDGESFGRSIAAIAPDYVALGACGAVTSDPGDLNLFVGPWSGRFELADAVDKLDGLEWAMGFGAAAGEVDGDGVPDFIGVEARSDLSGTAWLWSGTAW